MKMKIISLMLLCLLMLSTACIFPVHSSTPDSMWIEPPIANFSTNTTPVDTKFNVTVWLNMATATNSYQFYMIYNKAQLNVTNSGYSGNGKSSWSGALLTNNPPPGSGVHNATHDYVLWGEVLKTGAEKTGEGSLVWVEFQIMQAPPSGQTLTSDIRLDIDGPFRSGGFDKAFNRIPVTFGRTTYSYGSVWEPPPPAKMYVDPSAVVNRSITPSNNFTIYVKINKATDVAFFDFKLTFNSSVVKAWNAVLGDFFPPLSTLKVEVNNASGYVRVNATLNPSEPPKNGSGVLATIKFHVEATGSTVLHLTDIQLQDNQTHILPNESADGSFNNAALPGDVNGDGKVDIIDVAIVVAAFGSYNGQLQNHPRWDSHADINHDGIVDTFDVATVRQSYGLFG
jgi:hypothetical protein